jgi:hypothetical protein
VTFAIISKPKIKKTDDLIAQGKPMRGMRRLIIMGKTTPPTLEPLVAMPYAIPLFLSNHPARQAVAVKYQNHVTYETSSEEQRSYLVRISQTCQGKYRFPETTEFDSIE